MPALLRIAVLCLFLGIAALIPQAGTAGAFEKNSPAGAASAGRSRPSIEKGLQDIDTGYSGIPHTSSVIEGNIESRTKQVMERNAFAELSDSISAEGILMRGAPFVLLGITLVVIKRRTARRRRQKLILEVGSYPPVLVHCRPRREDEESE